jgi:hypothetical protein
MTSQHLSDEAVAAFADGVLGGHARDRAARHVNACAECRDAVQIQREAAYALRSAGAPALPTGLLDRLRTVPLTTPLTALPTVVGPDGSTVLCTLAPMAAFVPGEQRRGGRARPYITTVAVLALAGAALTAGSVARHEEPAQTGNGSVLTNTTPRQVGHAPAPIPALVYRGVAP